MICTITTGIVNCIEKNNWAKYVFQRIDLRSFTGKICFGCTLCFYWPSACPLFSENYSMACHVDNQRREILAKLWKKKDGML